MCNLVDHRLLLAELSVTHSSSSMSNVHICCTVLNCHAGHTFKLDSEVDFKISDQKTIC